MKNRRGAQRSTGTSRAPRHWRGVTLVEVLIVVAILGIIFIPLTRVLTSFFQTWWTGKAIMTVSGEAQDAMYWLVKDLKSSRGMTLGSYMRNGSFENPAWGSSVDNWDTATSTAVAFSTVTFQGNRSIRIFCPGPTEGAKTFQSNSIRLGPGNYRVCVMVRWHDVDVAALPSNVIELEVTGSPAPAVWADVTYAPPAAPATQYMLLSGALRLTASGNYRMQFSVGAGNGYDKSMLFDSAGIFMTDALLVCATAPSALTLIEQSPIETNCGFQFEGVMPEGSVGFDVSKVVPYRYRVVRRSIAGAEVHQVVREYLPSSTVGWQEAGFNFLAEDLYLLKIRIDGIDTAALSEKYKWPRFVEMHFRRRTGGQVVDPKWMKYEMSTYVYPLAD